MAVLGYDSPIAKSIRLNQMSGPFPQPPSWREKLRWPVRLLGAWLVMQGAIYALDAWQAASLRRRVALHLEAANPRRRHLGLVPISAALGQPIYASLQERDSLEWEQAYYQLGPNACPPGRVCHSSKVVRVDAATGKWWEESDRFAFTDQTSQPDGPRAYYLECDYSFSPKPGSQPWHIRLSMGRYNVQDSTSGDGYTLTLTRA
ncbi:MAG TPA: hypothetical protein VF690_21780, partial [Hymenobacter sp.]